jgi:hypothetical protein
MANNKISQHPSLFLEWLSGGLANGITSGKKIPRKINFSIYYIA